MKEKQIIKNILLLVPNTSICITISWFLQAWEPLVYVNWFCLGVLYHACILNIKK